MSIKIVPIHEVVDRFRESISLEGYATTAEPVAGLVTSTESLTDADTRKKLSATRDHFESLVQNTFTSLGMEHLGFSIPAPSEVGRMSIAQQNDVMLNMSMKANAVKAAGIVAMAAGNTVAFAKAALENRFYGEEGAPLVNQNIYSGFDYREVPALEAYDNKNLTDFLPYSIAFNIYGQRQDEFSELLFKTFVVPPEQAGVEINATRLLVYRDQNHVDRSHFDMQKKNLIRAHVDFTILRDESTKLVPVASADGVNDAQLVPETLVGTDNLLLAGVTVPTRPYKMGIPLNLIALSQYQPLVGAGAQFDNQDAVDSSCRLESLILSTGVAGAPGIEFSTLHLPFSTFQRSLAGNYRMMNLNFETEGLVIDGNTKAVDGSTVAAFNGIATGNYTVYLQLGVSGSLNTEKGNLSLSATTVTVAYILDADKNPIALDAGAGQTIVTALAGLTVAGFTLKVNRTNSNRRTRGLRIDTTLVRERYYVPLGAPLSVARPNDPWQQAQATDLKAIVTAARIRNTNNAVTALFNIIDDLRAYVKSPFKTGEDDSASVGGLGRLLVNPFFYEDTLNLATAVNSTSSSDKAQDVAGAIVNKIRDVSFMMLQQSNYQPALEAQLAGPSAKPTLFVGTDQILIRHIMVTGDDRTFTPMFDTAIVKESLDARMYGKIVLTFVRPEATEPDLLSFGAHIWSTELVSTLQVTRSGESNSIETMVQPRTLHINMMPVVAVITVTGLDEVLGTAVPYNVLGTLVASEAVVQTQDVTPSGDNGGTP